jgi:hypothetical protein
MAEPARARGLDALRTVRTISVADRRRRYPAELFARRDCAEQARVTFSSRHAGVVSRAHVRTLCAAKTG